MAYGKFTSIVLIYGLILVFFILTIATLLTMANTEIESSSSNDTSHEEGIHLFMLNWSAVKEPLIITAFIIGTAIAQLCFHHPKFHSITSIFPESCLLIIIGTVLALIVTFTVGPVSYFKSEQFFMYLLPPIMLESAFTLHNRSFGANIGTVLLYAVVGTLFATFTIGPSLHALSLSGVLGDDSPIPLVECLVFSALISAVDPVAVLAIFQEINVNDVLYFLVFGESLLNDAVTVVLYRMMTTFVAMDTIPAYEICMGVASFFVICFGAIFLGVVFGILCALITKSANHLRVIEPCIVLGMAYMCYVIAELFHFSGIIAIIICGLLQMHYSDANISHKSHTVVKYFSKMLSGVCDNIIFMFLGFELVSICLPGGENDWDFILLLFTIIFCTFYRIIGTVGMTWLINKNRVRKVNLEEQFIMFYGGLRGAVAFSLAILIPESVTHRSKFISTTLGVILFTVFFQGMTIKPLVKLLRIKRSDKHERTMNEEIHKTMVDHLMAGIEEITGQIGKNRLWETFEQVDSNYLKVWFQSIPESREAQIMACFQKISLREHLAHLHMVKSTMHLSPSSVQLMPSIIQGMFQEIPHDDIRRPSVQVTDVALNMNRGGKHREGKQLSFKDAVNEVKGVLDKSPGRSIGAGRSVDRDQHSVDLIDQMQTMRQRRTRAMSHCIQRSLTNTPNNGRSRATSLIHPDSPSNSRPESPFLNIISEDDNPNQENMNQVIREFAARFTSLQPISENTC